MRILFIKCFKFIILLLCISACSSDSGIKTEEQLEQEWTLKYKIKNVTEYKTPFKFGTEENEQLSHFKFFDEKGLKQKEIGYSNGSIETISLFEYDKNENLLNVKGINSDSGFLFKVTRTYYENNLRKDLYFYLPDGTYKYRNLATYDKAGKMIELKYYWTDGLKAINKYQYRGNKKTEDTEYSPEGEFRYKWIYKYDNRDNLIEALQYYPDSIINSKIIYEYDSGKLLTKQSNHFGESIQTIFLFTYNDKKLLSSKIEISAAGMISAKYRYQYEFY